ncbi:MAG: cation-transporting P-type ATPase, partial [Lachnospiraceae bacterium]|nr:cation-transporting P-type ATPase [Lachnospiraceae bacterium]
MLKKISDLFAGLKWTIVSGVFLVFSLVLLLTGKEILIDPAWITVILSGYPLLYLAITRLIYEKWISSALLISIAMIASIAIGEFFAAGEVAFIMAVGAILEDKTVETAKKGL